MKNKSRLTSLIRKLICMQIMLGLFYIPCYGYADDYFQIKAPRYIQGKADTEGTLYTSASDPEVCRVFLKNLRYFARRNEPLSCGQPVAPMLTNNIKPVEWEDLDPDQYSKLLWDIVSDSRFHYDDATKKKIFSDISERIRKKLKLFRRAKLDIKGIPYYRDDPSSPLANTEQPFQIVELAENVIDSDNPRECESRRGRKWKDSDNGRAFYIAKMDLSGFIDNMGSVADGFEGIINHLWLINGNLYGEGYSETGEVQLSQLTLKPVVIFEPVCAYWFDEKTKKENK